MKQLLNNGGELLLQTLTMDVSYHQQLARDQALLQWLERFELHDQLYSECDSQANHHTPIGYFHC
ncbi:MAG: hypothetical protein Tsb002_01370 [Wenzhouxiangellaceae bacterium]